METVEVRQYRTADGHIPFTEWITALRDRRPNQAIAARIERLRSGNRGDWESVGRGVYELRIDTGPGYRVYCGQDGATLVLLLCAGNKRTQTRDIERAYAYWKDYKARR